MSPGLTLASSGLLLDEDDLSPTLSPTFTEEVDQETVVNFADKLMDIDLTMLNFKTTFSLPFPLSGGVKRVYKQDLYLQSSPRARDLFSDSSSLFSDSLSDSSSLDSPPPHGCRGAPPPRPCDSYKRFLRMSPARCRPYYPSRDTVSDWVSETAPPSWPHRQLKKEPGFVNPREEMSLLRLSCTCQSRNTGKNLHLWEFLLELLADKRMRSVIAWTGQGREFRVVNSREVAREWGNRKNKPRMNFDKMSRAMRYYYKKNILAHGNKQRLVYTFSLDPLCPHYEKIITLALKTRPSSGTTPKESDSPQHAEVLESWEVTSPPATQSTCPARSARVGQVKSVNPRPAGSTTTHQIVPTRPPHSVPPRKPALAGSRREHQASRSKSRLEQSRDNHDQHYNRTVIRASNASRLVSFSNSPKIKINTKRPSYNDCFKFS